MKGGPKGRPRNIARRVKDQIRALLGVRIEPRERTSPGTLFDIHQIGELGRTEGEEEIRARCHSHYLGGNETLARCLGRYKMFLDTRDKTFVPHILTEGFWEYWVTQFVVRTVKPGMSFLDIGANFGYYSLLLSDLVGPDSKGIAVEPNPYVAEKLYRSLDVNGFLGRARVEQAAIGASLGTAALAIPLINPMNARMLEKDEHPASDFEVASVPVTTVDSLLVGNRIDFIKIDAEGAEAMILEGMQRTIRERPHLLIECNAGRHEYKMQKFAGELFSAYGNLAFIDTDGRPKPITPDELATRNVGHDWMIYCVGAGWGRSSGALLEEPGANVRMEARMGLMNALRNLFGAGGASSEATPAAGPVEYHGSAAAACHEGIVTRLDLLTAQPAEIQAEVRNIGLVASLPPERLRYRDLVANHHVPIAPPGPVRLTSSLCRQRDFTLDAHRYWTHLMRDPPRFHRKQWEFVFIAQALAERGQLAQGRAGIGFGVGREPLPALFASLGCRILATDQSTEEAARAGWTQSGQHADALASLRRLDICEEDRFDALVSFRNVDMNEIPQDLFGQFNFCWSSCCFEHLGSIEAGLRFVDHSMATLVPGGVAVHTTEFNLSSNDATLESRDLSIFRRRDIEALIDRLERQGHRVEPMEWDEGEGLVDAYVDLPPYRAEPGLKLRIGTYDCTSIGLIIERGTLA